MSEETRFEGRTRAVFTGLEWGVIVSIITSILTAAFVAGVVWQDVKSQGLRIDRIEMANAETSKSLTEMTGKIAAMDAKIDFLVQQARDDRARR